MDKEKLLEWVKRLWGVKERLVFGAVACVLAFRVYQILTANPLNGGDDGELPKPPQEIPYKLPERKRVRPTPPPVEEFAIIWRTPDMFTERGRDEKKSNGEEDKLSGFTLDSIQKSGNTFIAVLKREDGGSRFVSEGETFGSDLKVTKIDADKTEVEVFDNETKRTLTLSVEKEKSG